MTSVINMDELFRTAVLLEGMALQKGYIIILISADISFVLFQSLLPEIGGTERLFLRHLFYKTKLITKIVTAFPLAD